MCPPTILCVFAPSYAVTVRHLNYTTDTPLDLVTITLGCDVGYEKNKSLIGSDNHQVLTCSTGRPLNSISKKPMWWVEPKSVPETSNTSTKNKVKNQEDHLLSDPYQGMTEENDGQSVVQTKAPPTTFNSRNTKLRGPSVWLCENLTH